jgi:hypothetical protein
MSTIPQKLSIGTTPAKIMNAGKQDTPFLLETSILNTDDIYVAYAKEGFNASEVITLSPGSKLYWPHFVGALWAQANTGTQYYNLTQPPQGVGVPAFQSDSSAFFFAALPVDLIEASGQSYVGGLNVSVTAASYIFSANANAFVAEQVYNVPITVQIFIYTATAGNLTVYRTYGATVAQASEVFAVTANTFFKQEIPLDYLESFNLKYSATGTFLKFAVRQIGVTFSN